MGQAGGRIRTAIFKPARTPLWSREAGAPWRLLVHGQHEVVLCLERCGVAGDETAAARAVAELAAAAREAASEAEKVLGLAVPLATEVRLMEVHTRG